MTTAKDYRTHAKKCFIRAQETNSEESRQALLEMASYWMDAAMRTECLRDSRLEPEQQAAYLQIASRNLMRPVPYTQWKTVPGFT
jgi:hypothetical protein